MRLIYICFPYRGDEAANAAAAERYCRAVIDCHPLGDAVPVAPHLYFPRFLREEVPEERALGLSIGLKLLEQCHAVWVFCNGEPSEGMKAEIARARELCIPVRGLRPPEPQTKNKRRRSAAPFTPPTLEEVEEYCRERGKGVDAQAWYDHYTSNGWMVGRTKMKDWRAAVRTWERRRADFAPRQAQPAHFMAYDQRRYTNEELERLIDDLEG